MDSRNEKRSRPKLPVNFEISARIPESQISTELPTVSLSRILEGFTLSPKLTSMTQRIIPFQLSTGENRLEFGVCVADTRRKRS